MFWTIPFVLSFVFVLQMFKPIDGPRGDYDFSGPLFAMFRLFWIIPILVVWLIYFALT